ncbi:MAG: hypothetical protein AAFU64_16875, partial [Bacteroidota bacterium]
RYVFLYCFLIISSYFLSLSDCVATHIRGGEITYTQRQSLEFCFTLTLYTDSTPGVATSDQVQFFFGDGSPAIDVVVSSRVNIGNEIDISTYEICHVFPAPGSYDIHVIEENRDAGIVNFDNGNSVGAAFAARTNILINASLDLNNSPIFLDSPIFFAPLGQTFRQNMLAFDAQGDSLAYRLTNPLQNIDEIAPYFLPEGFKINQLTGEIIWDNPDRQGTYVFAVEIQKWRDGLLIGKVVRDIQINVSLEDFTLEPPRLSPASAGSGLDHPDGTRFEPGEPVSFQVITPKVFGQDITTELAAYGALIETGAAQVQMLDSSDGNGNMYHLIQIDWTPSEQEVRASPYTITFRKSYQGLPLGYKDDFTLIFYVGADAVSNQAVIVATEESKAYADNIRVFPNPVQSQ